MLYHSTRGLCPAVSPAEALLHGAAPDGGLYLPESPGSLSGLLDGKKPYAGLAARVFSALLTDFRQEDLIQAAACAYADQFDTPAITPLKKVGDTFVLELFHGPTAAFKDLALQALPRLMALARQQLTPQTDYLMVTATSGDTGSAAMRGFLNVPGFQVLVFYPSRGVSKVQQAQMTRMPGDNVRAVGIQGNFDDAQAAVKAVFSMDRQLLPERLRLSSANSINIGRLIPQIVYYIAACRELRSLGAALPGQAVDFIVPTGNFGDILAGYLARKMGLPIGQLVCASNANRVLADFLHSGIYDRRRTLKKTLSPSMDILVSSNLERLLFYASGQDADRTGRLMRQLTEKGWYQADGAMMENIRRDFLGASASDAQVLETIRAVWAEHRYLMDPHTAAAWHAQSALNNRKNPRVVLATASPFKFPEAVFRALGEPQAQGSGETMEALSHLSGQPIPSALKGLMDLPLRHRGLIRKDEIIPEVMRRANTW